MHTYTIPLADLARGGPVLAGVCLHVNGADIAEISSPFPAVFFHRFGRFGAVLFGAPTPGPHLRNESIIVALDGKGDVHPVGVTQADARVEDRSTRQVECESIRAAPTRMHRGAAEYFRSLDVASHIHVRPNPKPPPGDSPSPNEVANKLLEDISSGCNCYEPPPDFHRFSDLLFDAMASVKAPTRESVAATHGIFASAEVELRVVTDDDGNRQAIRSGTSNGRPNSDLFYAYPAFALAMLKNDPRWHEALPGLVAAVELYILCFGQLDGERLVPPLADSEALPRRLLTRRHREWILQEHLNLSDTELRDRLGRLIEFGRPRKLADAYELEPREDGETPAGYALRYRVRDHELELADENLRVPI